MKTMIALISSRITTISMKFFARFSSKIGAIMILASNSDLIVKHK